MSDKDNMESEDMATNSDSETEMIASLIDDDDDDEGVRYSLRSRTISKTDAARSDASTGAQDAAETSKASTGVNTLATADDVNPSRSSQVIGVEVQRRLQHAQITGNATNGDAQQDVENRGEELRRRISIPSLASPFELTSARGWTADRRMPAPERRVTDERMAYTDVRRTRTQEGPRAPLPFALERRDVLFIPPVSQGVGVPGVTSALTTRMTPREQPRIMQDANARTRMTGEDSPTWIEYQRRHADELEEGRRAMERIAARAADPGDESDLHLNPRLLLVGGHDAPYAGRMDPETRKCDNATRAGSSRGAIGHAKEAAGRGGDEFHKKLERRRRSRSEARRVLRPRCSYGRVAAAPAPTLRLL